MPKLVSRERYIPNGFRFYQPEIKWQAPPNASFNTIVNNLISARQANPDLMRKHGWSVDYNTVANEVDTFNANLCASMGWNDFITPAGGQADAAPFHHSPRPLSNRLPNVAAGAETLIDWLKSGAEAVSPELANSRAAVCATCQFNTRGDLTRLFTVPISEAIRAAINQRRDFRLSTTSDDQLGVCDVCLCPMKLKVHMPLEMILPKIKPETFNQLPAQWCWMRKEAGK